MKAKTLKLKRRRAAWNAAKIMTRENDKIKSVKVIGKTAYIVIERILPGTPQNMTISAFISKNYAG
jgi:hypothetical protein